MTDELKVLPDLRQHEPEERLIQRRIGREASVSVGAPGHGQSTGKTIGGDIVVTQSAADLANQLRHPCFSCRHFDPRGGQAMLNSLLGEADQLSLAAFKQKLRAALGVVELTEDDLKAVGICHAFSTKDGSAVVLAQSRCPPDDVRYEKLGLTAQKPGVMSYDAIMRMAQGKI